MELIKNCKICGKEIENPRRGKMYCSESCRSKAYHQRKNQKEQVGQILEKQAANFFFEEYEQILKMCGINGCDLNFQAYCFYRHNIKGNPTIQEIAKVFRIIDWHDLDKGGCAFNAYSKFLEKYYLEDNVYIEASKES